MVVFTCQNCNGCLKKKDVEKHVASKCRGAILTCIDCVKDFDCKSYASHLTCVTESERYGGKNFVPSTAMQKQQEWIKCIADVSASHQANVMVKKILSYAADYPTCPRNKKKFVNFILNNKAFSKFRSNAESAFDLISNEFNIRHPQNDNSENTQQDNANGKRKKISETEVQEEEKTDKKLNGNNEHNKDKKKKKKNKKNSESKDEEVEENGEEAVETQGKKKKKNKQRKNSKSEIVKDEEEDIDNGETEEIQNGDHEVSQNGDHEVTQNGVTVLNGVDLSKLSKKERKKLLKQQKYEAEKNSIENYKKDEEEEIVENGEGEKKAKKKKQKHAEEQKDRKQKRSISEPDDKKIRLEEDEQETEEVVEDVQKPKKFKWDEVIIQVLQTQDDGEMSLKRLSKKLCAEYANVYGERESYEEVLNKFHKKVQRTPGVRVLKDKAKLIATA